MRVFVAVMTATVAALAGCAGLRKPEPPTGPAFSVLTYNVNFGGGGQDSTLQAIADADADIVCLQETTPRWERALRDRFGQRYPRMRFLHWGGAGGLAVLSRFDIAEIKQVPPSGGGWFPAWILQARTPAGPVQIVNVHLHPPLSERGAVSVGAYLTTPAIRRNEVEAIWRAVSPDMPTLVVGDFNENDGGKAVRYLVGRGLTNALREFDRSSKTWRWPTRLGTVRDRYDHILYSRGLHCLRAGVSECGGSDHLPVRAQFQAAAPGEAVAAPAPTPPP